MYKTPLAIVITAYNRAGALARLLQNLSQLIYEGDDITLIISIDNQGIDEVNRIANEYKWNFGEKIVLIHDKKLGLRNHFIYAGDFTEQYENVLFIEDDLFLSSYAIDAIRQMIAFYHNDPSVAGISLYSPLFSEFDECRFYAIDDGSDVFFFQHPYWGNVWMREAWRIFKKWFENYQLIISILPVKVATWKDTSFKKVFIQYLIENNKTIVYPRKSFVTNMGEVGLHHKDNYYQFQVPICMGKPELNLRKNSESNARYDAWWELEPSILKKYCRVLNEYDFEVDLRGTRAVSRKEYVLTSRPVKKAILTFSDKVKPIENAVIMNITGQGLSFARADDVIMTDDFYFSRQAGDIKANYMLRTKAVGMLWKSCICHKLNAIRERIIQK